MKKKYFLYGGIGLVVIILGVVIMSLSNPDRKVKIVDSEIKNIIVLMNLRLRNLRDGK